jgi:hypothetical protein
MNPSICLRLLHFNLEYNSPPHKSREISKSTIYSTSSKLKLRAENGGVVPHTLMEILRKLQLLFSRNRTAVSNHAVDHLVGQTYLFWEYSRTPLIRRLVIRIGLALLVNLSRILQSNFPWNYRVSKQVEYTVMASRTSNQAWLKGLETGTCCK